MKDRPVTVLLVDDDRVDAAAVRRSFAALGIDNPMVEARNGVEALEVLRGENGNARLTNPYIVLLDLNMPCMGGLEFLAELRADPRLHTTVVFVLTTSDAADDRRKSYEQHVAGYVLKHVPGQRFQESLAMLQNYWRIVQLPCSETVASGA